MLSVNLLTLKIYFMRSQFPLPLLFLFILTIFLVKISHSQADTNHVKRIVTDSLRDTSSHKVKVLSKINIVAAKPVLELKAGMSIYNVQSDPMATGKQLNEVLENLPGVSTDANGSIKVNGVSEILVMINRRTSRMNYNDLLKQMPASSIERVELIQGTNPRYAASGAEYVINIVTKRERSKAGTLAASAGTNTMLNSLFTYNYSLKKVNYYTRINYSKNNMPHLREYVRENEFSGTDLFSMNGNNRMKHTMGNVTIGMDHYVDSNNQVSFEYGLNLHTDDFSGSTHYLEYDTIRDSKKQFFNNVQTQPREVENNFSLNYQRKINKLSTIETELYYSRYNQKNKRTSPLAGQTVNSLFKSYNVNFNSELQVQKSKKLFIAGVAFRRVRINNQLNSISAASNTITNVKNNVDAAGAYASLTITMGKSSFSAGLRSELLQLSSDETGSIKRDTVYKNLSFYPSLFYKKPLSQSATLTLAASRKVIYPEVHFVFNSPNQADDFDMWSGNAELTPAVANRIQADINFKKKKTTYAFSTFFVATDHAFGRIQSFQNNIRNDRFVNFDSRTSYGISSNINFSLAKWLSTRITANASVNHFKTNAGEWIKFNDGFFVSGSVVNLVTFSKKVSFENAVRVMNISRNIYEKATPVVNITAQVTWKPIANDKIVFSLFGHDLLNEMRFKTVNYLNEEILQTSVERGRWTRFLRLNFNYRFGGNTKMREKKIMVEKVNYIQG